MSVIKHKNIFLVAGIGVMMASLALIFIFGLKPGIDFTGGSLMEVSYTALPDKSMLEESLVAMDLGGYSLREAANSEGRAAYMLRTRNLSEEERVAIEALMVGSGSEANVERFTSVGPVIGSELAEKAKWAIGAVALIIVVYIAFVFAGVRWPVGSSVYGAITVLSLAHDVLVPAALMSLLGYFYGVEVDVLFVMALLAVLGYSVNDTIVVFDRVRENIVKYRHEHKRVVSVTGGMKREESTYSFDRPFADIVDISVNESLLRSINTSLTTAVALIAIYVFGGEVTKNFALVLLAGVAAGAYSSIFFASPLLVWYSEWRESKTK